MYIILGIKLISVIILLVGLLLCMKDLLLAMIGRGEVRRKPSEIQKIKNNLGWYVLLGLEILIIGDIIESIVNPSFADIARLGAIVLIRTVISFFLNKEIEATNSTISKEIREGE